MITIIGILVGALIVGLIWTNVYFSHEIAELRTKKRGYPMDRPISYSNYYNRKDLEESRLDAKIEEAKKVRGDLDSKIDEGLILIESMDKRGIRGGCVRHRPTEVNDEEEDNEKD